MNEDDTYEHFYSLGECFADILTELIYNKDGIDKVNMYAFYEGLQDNLTLEP
jgi:hypothetical protein